MLAPEWTWWSAAPVVLVAVTVFLIPGGFLLRILGLRGPLMWGAAPLLSTAIITGGGILASYLSIPWGWLALLVSVAFAWSVAAVIRRLVGGEPLDSAPDPPMDAKAAMYGLLTGFVVAAAIFAAASGSPGNIPQQPDVILHLGIAKTFIEDRDISALTGLRFMSEADAGFYHAAIHAVAATVGLLTGAPPVVAMSSTVLVVVGLVFPAGMLLLVRAALNTASRSVLLMTPVITTAFLSFPWRTVGLGPWWPLTLGNALVPAALALLLLSFRRRSDGVRSTRGALVALALGAPTLALAHVSAAMAAAVFAWFWGMESLIKVAAGWSAPRKWGTLALALVLTAAALAVGVAVAPEVRLQASGNRGSLRLSLLGGATWWAEGEPTALVLGAVLMALTILGAVMLWRSGVGRWLVVAWATLLLLTVVAGGFGSQATRWITWPWYNGQFRLRSLVVIAGAPLAVAGAGTVLALLQRRGGLRRFAAPGVGIALAFLVLAQALVTQSVLATYYRATGPNSWVTAEEITALRYISAILPDGAVVAANPWNGATYLALVGPERLLFPWDQARGERVEILGGHLDAISTDSEVCRMAMDAGVTHVITGGDPYFVNWMDYGIYDGIDAVGAVEGFTRLGSAGPYTVYAVEPCAY